MFYDTGIGVLSSIHKMENNEMENNQFKKIISKFQRIFGDERTLKLLCTTNLSKYKKSDKNIDSKVRGQGMPSYKISAEEISKTYPTYIEVVTRNYIYSSYNNEVQKINHSLQGSLVHWIIDTKKDKNYEQSATT